jgi:pilus assembly protein FimV
VTSLEPIREPNFNFLLELTWPRGRLIREFPVQLDPELYANRRPPPLPSLPMLRLLRADCSCATGTGGACGSSVATGSASQL